MTARTFELELADLRRNLVAMGGLVEQAATQAVEALAAPTAEAKQRASDLDDRLDAMQEDLEQRIHRLLALQNPMVRDLRLAVSSLRIVALFEQIGDLAEGVSKRAAWIARHRLVANPEPLSELGRVVVQMIREAAEAYVTGSTELAKRMTEEESVSDRLTKSCFEGIQVAMALRPELIKEYTHLLRAVANLEHMGDLAVLIAEEAIFIHSGKNMSHHLKEL
jgi:phosphate transport system protein